MHALGLPAQPPCLAIFGNQAATGNKGSSISWPEKNNEQGPLQFYKQTNPERVEFKAKERESRERKEERKKRNRRRRVRK